MSNDGYDDIQERYTDELAAFTAYLLMGPERSLPAVRDWIVENGGDDLSVSTVRKWANKYNWQKRASDYDKRLHDEASQAAAGASSVNIHDIMKTMDMIWDRFSRSVESGEDTFILSMKDLKEFLSIRMKMPDMLGYGDDYGLERERVAHREAHAKTITLNRDAIKAISTENEKISNEKRK